jgi:hypothetical protein
VYDFGLFSETSGERALLPVMERNQPEWVQRFGSKMRTERAACISDPLPTAIVAKLQAIEDAERQLQIQEAKARGVSGEHYRDISKA